MTNPEISEEAQRSLDEALLIASLETDWYGSYGRDHDTYIENVLRLLDPFGESTGYWRIEFLI